MLISQLIESLSENAVITPLTPSSVIVFDKNELKVFVGFTNARETVEYTKEVTLLLSSDLPKKADIQEIVVSKNGDYAILVGPRIVYVVRIASELLISKPDRLPSESFCECYPLNDSFLLQNHALTVVKTRILSTKIADQPIAALLFSDNCIRFYNIHRKLESLLLTIDFRQHLHQNHDDSIANNTFGLQRALVSFDIIPPLPKSAHFSLLVVDSEVEFYGCFVHFTCFTEGVVPRIHRIEAPDGLPCDPLALQYIETSNPKISSVFVLVSGGGVLSHLVVFPNEFGEFQLLVNDQLRLPISSGDPQIVTNQIRKLNRNRYEIATATCLYSVNISPWFDNPMGDKETRVCGLVSVVDSELASRAPGSTYTGARALRAISVVLTRTEHDDEHDDDVAGVDSDEVLHLVILDTKQGRPAHLFTVATFEKNNAKKTGVPRGNRGVAAAPKTKSSLEQQLCELKPIVACLFPSCITEEQAIVAAQKFFDRCDERMKKHAEIAAEAIDRSLMLAASAQLLDEKQQEIDQRLVVETTAVEQLKASMQALKTRMESTRKAMNVLFQRVEDNVPLSDNETRIFERLKEHQKMLSEMSIQVPKMTLDANQLHRAADLLAKRRIGEEPNKFANVDKNTIDIENLEQRELKLRTNISEFAV